MTAEPSAKLLVFVRHPQPGETKTRLIPLLGEAGAADLQRQMTEHTLATAEAAGRRWGFAVEIRYAGGSADRMRRWLGHGRRCRAQVGSNIGERMHNALREALAEGCERVVIIGTDIPALSGAILARAFERLAEHDVVLGPAADGGYYLIGAGRRCPPDALSNLFSGIAWSTGRVLAQSLERIRAGGLTHRLLETLHDVDRPRDLCIWGRHSTPAGSRPQPVSVSVIIPALNESGCLPRALASIGDRSGVEKIVVDGGSTDGTAQLATAHGATVLTAPPSRAKQMNAGAALAQGEVLIFLHADTRLPKGFEKSVRACLRRPGVVLGAFRLRIDHRARRLRIIERVANWRSRYLKMPYGDQALFLEKSVFQKLGGYADIPIMEDFDLVRRARKYGRVTVAPAAVVTSARRWENLGVLRTWLVNQAMIFGHCIGISPQRLAAWYRYRPENRSGASGPLEKRAGGET
jgi:rSAM/selenodomain-associated transferase 2/rSAM/selenodomain-associated transferase 1